MYMRAYTPTPTDENIQRYIRNCEIEYDDRMAFVERVCALLSESRYGPGCDQHPLSHRPEHVPAVFFELSDDGPTPFYIPQIQGRSSAITGLGGDFDLGYIRHLSHESARLTSTRSLLLTVWPNAPNLTSNVPSNQGRGSPGSSLCDPGVVA